MKSKLLLFVLFISFHLFSQSPTWQWAKNEGGSGPDNASGIATDNLGNSYVCGYYYSSTLSIGSATFTNNGNYDFYIAKFDNSGNPLWAKSYGGTFDDNVTAVAIDASGNVFVTGYFISPVLVCGTFTLINSGAGDMFLMKLDTNGNLLWAKNMGDGGSNQSNALATDLAGNVFLTGFFNNPTLTIGTTTLISKGNDDIVVAKFDSAGNSQWALSFGNSLSDAGHGIATDLSGNVFITGYYKSPSLAAGTGTLVNASPTSADVFLIKLSNTGVIIASNSLGDAFDEIGNSITTDNTGNVIITGSYFSPTLTVGTSTLNSYGNRDILVVKYNSNCNVIWAKGGGGASDDYGYGIVTDAAGRVYVNGHNHSVNATFGTYTVGMLGVGDGVMIAYDSAGNELWLDGFGGTSDDGWNAISVDGAGNIYSVGYFSSTTASVGTFTLISNGVADFIIAKIVTSNQINTPDFTSQNALSIYPNPTNGEFYIRNLNNTENCKIEIRDMKGVLIYINDQLNLNQNIQLNNQAPGIYIITFFDKEQRVSKKLVLN